LKNCIRFGLGAAAALLVAAPAHATTLTFTTLASFQAAAGATVLEDFSTASLFNATGAFGPTAYNGFSLTGNGNGNNIGVHTGAVANAGPDTPFPASFNGQRFFSLGNLAGGTMGTLTFTFNAPITAFGFDWFNTDVTDRYNLSAQVAGGGPFVNPPFSLATFTPNATASTGFFGLVSDTPFTTVTIFNNITGGYMSDEGFDNVRTSAAAVATPEPGTMLLMAGGLAAAVRRRRSRKSEAARS